jgi:hypothetical protein
MLGGIGQRQADFGGQRIDGAFALGEQFEDFESMRVGERFADSGELAVEAVLEVSVGVRHGQVINRLLDYDLSSPADRSGAVR